MDFIEDSLDRLKSIVRCAIRYGKSTGLHPSISDLQSLKRSLAEKGLNDEAQEIGFIINFLEREKTDAMDLHKRKLDRVNELYQSIPIGMIISFRHFGKTLTGEIKGYLADRVLVMVPEGSKKVMYEVCPFDIKA